MNTTGIAYRLVRATGLPWLFREVLYRRPCRVLMFHDPSPEAMDRALSHLGRHYTFITLAQLMHNAALPPKSVLVTLDDGHRGNAALLPVFQRHGVRPVIFLCAGIVGTHRHFWFRHRPLPAKTEALKRLPDAERLRLLASSGFTPEQEFPERQALSLAEIGSLRPHVDLASHGMLHPCLDRCPDHVSRFEIGRSKTLLDERFGVRTTAFAFPNGDYTQREIDLLQEHGYTHAFTVDHGFYRPGMDPLRIRRLSIDDGGDPAGVCVKASGVWGLLRILLGLQPRLRGHHTAPKERP
jgi:peptidoglycan/xylan/chitin deacetylase (PgdA/CDA1 family)